MTTVPKPRWFRFSLRTLFVVVTVSSIFIAFIVWFIFWMLRLWAMVDLGMDQSP